MSDLITAYGHKIVDDRLIGIQEALGGHRFHFRGRRDTDGIANAVNDVDKSVQDVVRSLESIDEHLENMATASLEKERKEAIRFALDHVTVGEFEFLCRRAGGEPESMESGEILAGFLLSFSRKRSSEVPEDYFIRKSGDVLVVGWPNQTQRTRFMVKLQDQIHGLTGIRPQLRQTGNAGPWTISLPDS